MSEKLINADKYEKELMERIRVLSENGEPKAAEALSEALAILKKQPTVNARPEKYGRWNIISDYDFFVCSECGFEYFNGADYGEQAREMLKYKEFYPHCPNCAAEMEAGKDERKGFK